MFVFFSDFRRVYDADESPSDPAQAGMIITQKPEKM
jgi:hypothetical protein